MSITASQVKTLRERTSAAMMDCKKALQACDGDMDQAADWLRSKGQAKADKKAGRQTAEGRIAVYNTDQMATILEVNCETDFVARDENFKAFCEQVVKTAGENSVNTVADLMSQTIADAEITVEESRKQLIAKIGENIQIRRMEALSTTEQLGFYLHGGRIGVLIEIQNGDADLARDIAMHIAASAPQVIAPENVAPEAIAKERSVFETQAAESGKAPEIIAKMVEGRIKKFLNEISLTGQAFVKDPDKTVGAYLKSKEATVVRFIRYEVGEGVEKEETDFAAEVMAQINQG